MRSATGIVLAALVLLACLAPPLAVLADAVSRDGMGAFTLLLDGRQWQLFQRSLLVASTAMALSWIWGIPTALVIVRSRGLPGAVFEVLSYVPLLLPPIVVVMGWIHFLGRSGPAGRVLGGLFGAGSAPSGLYSPLGAGFVLSLCYFPCVSILCAQGFRSMDSREPWAAELVASSARRLRSLWLPRIFPHAAAGSSLVFCLAFADFAVPAALMVNVYPVEIQAQLTSDPVGGRSRAAALAIPPLVLALLLCAVRHAYRGAAPAGTGGDASRAHPPARTAAALSLLAVLLGAALPLTFLALAAGGPDAYARAVRAAGAQVLDSLEVSAWAALGLLVLAIVFGAAWSVLTRAARASAEAALLLTLMVPGAAVGLGILTLVNLQAPPWSWLYPHPAILAYASACRYVAFPALIIAGAVTSLGPDLLHAGAAGGAGLLRIAGRLTLPLLLPAILSAAAISFVLSLGELSAAVLVSPPGVMTLSVRLASLLHFGEDSIVAALCVMVSGFVLLVLLLVQLLANRPLRIELHHEN